MILRNKHQAQVAIKDPGKSPSHHRELQGSVEFQRPLVPLHFTTKGHEVWRGKATEVRLPSEVGRTSGSPGILPVPPLQIWALGSLLAVDINTIRRGNLN